MWIYLGASAARVADAVNPAPDQALPRGGRAAGRAADRLLDTRHTGSVPGAAVIVTASSPAVAAGAAGCGCPGYHPGWGSTPATARRPGRSAPSWAARPAWASRTPARAGNYGPRQRGD